MQRKSFLFFIAASILIHLSLVISAQIFQALISISTPKKEITSIEVVLQESPPEFKNEPLEVKKQTRSQSLKEKMQMVEQDENAINREIPTDSRFFSHYNQVVEKETVAQAKGQFQNTNKSGPAQFTQNLDVKKSGTKNVGPDKLKETPKVTHQVSLKDLNPSFDPFAVMKKQVQQEEDQKKVIQAARGDGVKGSLFGAETQNEQVSQTSDYLNDLDRGLETLLSTKEHKFYTYFTRIRRQLDQHWQGRVRDKFLKIYAQKRTLASQEDKITRLLFFLDQQGELIKVQVLGASGVVDLDDAAVEALRAAAPFPNPPKGVIDPDGTAKISWSFVVET